MANDAVFKYLVDTNRPYSCADVTVNLRGAFTKGAVQKALDALSEGGKIKCKLYGKQKVYAAIQPETTAAGDGDVEDYDTQLKTLAQELTDKTTSLKSSEVKLKSLTSTPTTESAKITIEDIRNSVDTLEGKLEALRNSTEVISADEKRKMMGEHDKYLREYRRRKRMCSDMLEAVLEGHPKSKKDFIEELCIETDEVIGFKLMS